MRWARTTGPGIGLYCAVRMSCRDGSGDGSRGDSAAEETMKSDRRTFLKTTGVVGGALLAGVAARGASTPAAAQARVGGDSSGGAPAGGMARGMTFCTLRREAG